MSDINNSYHIFMFPFKWDNKHNQNDDLRHIDFEKRVVERVDDFSAELEKNNWQKKQFKPSASTDDYNQYKYFYPYARRAIYFIDDKLEESPGTELVYDNSEKDCTIGEYIIDIKGDDNYALDIDAIKIKIYETGVALLSFHLTNKKYKNFKEIRLINDFGRRIYPQFLSNNGKQYVDFAKNKFLPNCITIKTDGIEIIDDFSYFNKYPNISENPNHLPDFIMELLGNKFVDNKNGLKTGSFYIQPVLDDRMFVISWYKSKILINKFSTIVNGKYNYLNSDLWYKYIFIDGKDKTCSSKELQKNLISNATYDRWIESGSLYGVTPYSLVLLTSDTKFAQNVLQTHLKTMYYEMTALTLAQRASILSFSEEVSFISDLNESNLVVRVRELHKYYIRFVNRMYFKEISAFEQGIEIFDKMQEMMRIESEINDLDEEINELHNYASLIEDKKTGTMLNILTIIGALFIIPSFVAGFFGVNIDTFMILFNKYSITEFFVNAFVKPKEFYPLWYWLFFYFDIPAIVIGILITIFTDIKIVNIISKTMEKGRIRKLLTIIIIGLLLLFILLPIYYLIYYLFIF